MCSAMMDLSFSDVNLNEFDRFPFMKLYTFPVLRFSEFCNFSPSWQVIMLHKITSCFDWKYCRCVTLKSSSLRLTLLILFYLQITQRDTSLGLFFIRPIINYQFSNYSIFTFLCYIV